MKLQKHIPKSNIDITLKSQLSVLWRKIQEARLCIGLILISIFFSCNTKDIVNGNVKAQANHVVPEQNIENYFAENRFDSCESYCQFLNSLFIEPDSIQITKSSLSKSRIIISGKLKGFSGNKLNSLSAENQELLIDLIINESCLELNANQFFKNLLSEGDFQKLSEIIKVSKVTSIAFHGFCGLSCRIENNKFHFATLKRFDSHKFEDKFEHIDSFMLSNLPIDCHKKIELTGSVFHSKSIEYLNKKTLRIEIYLIGESKEHKLSNLEYLYFDPECFIGLSIDEVLSLFESEDSSNFEIISIRKIKAIEIRIIGHNSIVLHTSKGFVDSVAY